MSTKSEKTIYFTFDDGPSEVTPRLLEILRENGIRASFFVTAKYGCSELLKTIRDEGHLVCLHSYSHEYSDIYADENSFLRDLSKLEALVQKECGEIRKIYRFPGGACNSANRDFMFRLAEMMERRGYLIFDWDSDNRDGIAEGESTAAYLSAALSQISRREKTIFLMHNRPQDSASIESLPMIIRFCRQNGYRPALLDELSESSYCLKKRKNELNATEFIGLSVAESILLMVPLIQQNALETGIPASVLLGQFIYESDYGKSPLAQMSNNLFGMKTAVSGNTWEGSSWSGKSVCIETSEMDDEGNVYRVPQEFRSYETIENSVRDHGMYLLHAKNGDRLRYEGISGADPFGAAEILQAGGYSTFQDYSKKLKMIIRYWNLERFDRERKEQCIR